MQPSGPVFANFLRFLPLAAAHPWKFPISWGSDGVKPFWFLTFPLSFPFPFLFPFFLFITVLQNLAFSVKRVLWFRLSCFIEHDSVFEHDDSKTIQGGLSIKLCRFWFLRTELLGSWGRSIACSVADEVYHRNVGFRVWFACTYIRNKKGVQKTMQTIHKPYI